MSRRMKPAHLLSGHRQRGFPEPPLGGELARPNTFRPIGQVHASVQEHTHANQSYSTCGSCEPRDAFVSAVRSRVIAG